MKERPILFSAPMVHALLKGCKTQTRRLAHSSPPHPQREADLDASARGNPFGSTGDLLWVKETWSAPAEWDDLKPSELSAQQLKDVSYHADNPPKGKTRSSLFMPRKVSRILLEIVEVRRERLQSISEADAWAEGVAGPDVIGEYAKLWDRINGSGSWASNPWVWVVSFRRIR